MEQQTQASHCVSQRRTLLRALCDHMWTADAREMHYLWKWWWCGMQADAVGLSTVRYRGRGRRGQVQSVTKGRRYDVWERGAVLLLLLLLLLWMAWGG